MTTLPDLEPVALEAATSTLREIRDTKSSDRYVAKTVVNAYLAARSVPEAGKAVTLRQLQAAHIERQAEWCPDQVPDLSFRGNEMAGEVGEACNIIKKLERERQGWRGSRATKEQLAEELGDVIHTAILCAITAGIDIEPATVAKFNSTSEKNGLSTFISALASVPAPSGAEPAYWAIHSKSGSHIGLWQNEDIARDILREYEGGTITQLYAAPQAVPAEDVAGQAWQELVEKDDRTSPAEYPDMALITRGELEGFIGTALTILSTRLDWAESGQRTDNINSNRYFEKWQASEAEATSLRHRLDMLQADFNDCNSVRADLRRRLEEAEAEIERMTPKFVAYEYLESPAGREIAEARVAVLEGRLEEYRRALEPFARLLEDESLGGSELDDGWKPLLHRNYTVAEITNGDFRRARTLSGSSE